MDYKDYFKNKKVTVMGLGLLGRGVGDTAFLAKNGAEIIVTDLKSEEALKESLKKLSKYKNITYRLGEHNFADFCNRDFILKAAGVPLDSPYIAEARKNNIEIEMSASLFSKLANLSIIGVTGTRGKSTVTHLLDHILKTAKKKVLLGGNILGVSTLALLPESKKVDYALFELDSWQLQGFGESKNSPHIAIFTTFYPDHLNYYKNNLNDYFKDKSYIFKNQKKGDILILGKQVQHFIRHRVSNKVLERRKRQGRFIVPDVKLPKGFKLSIPGEHNIYNATLAVEVARTLGIKDTIIKKALKNFKGVEGRLELIRKVKGISFYNDTTATTPDATIAALHALKPESKNLKASVILIMGGSDKGLEMTELLKILPSFSKKVILLSGSGTERVKSLIKDFIEVDSMKEAIISARQFAKRGDIILLSPAFASFGMFKNEFDRGAQFVKIVKKLK